MDVSDHFADVRKMIELVSRRGQNDGHQSVVDLGEFIRQHPHPQYNKYLDPKLFRTFVVDDGNVVWGEDWDLIFPIENLYIGKAA